MRIAPALAALLVLLAAGCSDDPATDDPDVSVKVEEGKQFTWNSFTVADGWKIETKDAMVAMQELKEPSVVGSVTNDADETRFAVFRFVFVDDGEALATVQCTSDEIKPDDSVDMICRGLGQELPESYESIQVSAIPKPSS